MPGYFADAVEYASRGFIQDTFTPLCYPFFIGIGFALRGMPGIIGLQLLLHIVVSALSYLLLRLLRVPPYWAAVFSLPIAIHPELLSSIVKIWDVPLSTALLLLFAALCVAILRNPQRRLIVVVIAAGIALGLGVFCRPNYILLCPGIIIALRFRSPTFSVTSLSALASSSLVAAALSYGLACFAAHGSLFFPGNGPYNLYAGHNARTARALLREFNAEPSIVSSLQELPDGRALLATSPTMLGTFYTHAAASFARAHPFTEIGLIFLKLFTLLRPATMHYPLLSWIGLLRCTLALPVVVLAAVLLIPRRPSLLPEDKLLLFLAVLYVVPFLITNSDPRFRTPLDILVLAYLGSLLYRYCHRSDVAENDAHPECLGCHEPERLTPAIGVSRHKGALRE